MVYLVRHCQATGQQPEAKLTQEGEKQAQGLADFFEGKGVIHIVSSPYARALQSIAPAAERLGLPVKTDARLVERILSTENLPDWMEHLERSFSNSDKKLPGGESGREAAERGLEVLREVPAQSVLVTHGNLMALLLTHFEPDFGFEGWKTLANPDIFEVRWTESEGTIKRAMG
ncbi:histidine phosphatase family protein [Planococcus sp. FY231025]|uniref:histidine phosphatase family protein n=1 Tax=Planococcus sp. FY231025 TaxID=3455699 RepID=UPI003F8D943C